MEINAIKKVLANLVFYVEPNILKDESANELRKGNGYRKKHTERYCDLVMHIDWFLDKIAKYEWQVPLF